MKKMFFILFSMLFVPDTNAAEPDSLKKGQHFEFSFGQSLLFISTSRQNTIQANADIVVPTTAILFFGQLRPQKKLRIPLFLNLATETKQFLVDNVLISEKASPTFGFGFTYKAFQIKIDDETKVEFEVGPLISFIADRRNNIRIAPIVAGRFRILRGRFFSMYIGASYSFGIKAFGILYGTGSLF